MKKHKALLDYNFKYIKRIILIVAIFLVIENAVSLILSGELISQLDTAFLAFHIDVVFLSMAAINGTYLIKNHTRDWVNDARKAIAAYILMPTISVAIVSSILETFYFYIGIIDNDTINLGNIVLNPYISNVIQYSFITMSLAVPVAFWKVKVDKLNVEIDKKNKEKEKLERLKVEAELKSLQSRINPHFLFNSFNSIIVLIQSDPDKAEKMMHQLSDLFRYSLNKSQNYFVPLDDELEMIKKYLAVESIRFGARLNVEYNLAHQLNIKIPKYILQPLIENALKYGEDNEGNVYIRLSIYIDHNYIILQLVDNGHPFPDEMNFGFGLQSIVETLSAHYENTYEMNIINKPLKQIELKLPIKEHDYA